MASNITLLNVDFKILARLIAKRIEPKLPTLIHTDQTGFVKERFIGQNVRLLIDIMDYTKMNKIPGIMVFIDYQKDFLSLDQTLDNGYLCFIVTWKVVYLMEAT